MPCGKWEENENNIYRGTEEPSFMTKYYFAAIVKHFEKLLEELKLDEEQYRIRLEMKNLIDIFKSSYAESQRKTHKIFELKAANAVEKLRIKTSNSEQDKIIKGLRDMINVLQRNLDTINKQRKELFEELEGLRKGVETADKATETHDATKSPRLLPRKKDHRIFQSLVEGVIKAKKTDEKAADDELLEKESVETQPEATSDVEFLKNDLDILVADLKMTRQKVTYLQKEVSQRDIIIKKYDEELSALKETLKESRSNDEAQKTLKSSMEKYQEELEKNKQKNEKNYKDLQAALDLNTKLLKDDESKELIIANLQAKLEVLVSERESNDKKMNIYEEHLARSQNKIKTLKQEIESLKYEVEEKKKEITDLEKIRDTIQPEKEIDVGAQERFVENLKHQILLREKKLLSVGNELQEKVEVLLGVKRDHEQFREDKLILEKEVENLKEILKERNEDLKLQKEKFKTNEKEVNNTKKELYSWVKKCQRITEKKNKFHDLYNSKKVEKSELEKENIILVKRQQYLLKILKEKDKEIMKLLQRKEYNNKIK